MCRKVINNLYFQWGNKEYSNTGTVQVTFPLSLTNTSYGVSISVYFEGGLGYIYGINFGNKEVSGMIVGKPPSGGKRAYWIVIGY